MLPKERLKHIKECHSELGLYSDSDWLIKRIEHLEKGLNLIRQVDDTGTGGYIEEVVFKALEGEVYE